ncbi:lasso peptide biosynthesis B2 protein [Paenibacillus sp. LMG 31456]|uniref:Lasso peptide biosynthesis B2 protein n=1 Tax=Paenibacillus foliorum TaxID=2654974 RepID=A0A972GW19_9BACL|nr:lasso peptide biosynthesis B2 protein [Paenibacillus foliorum]NOU97348.1 lasso peptide biosynthesis B2 protein [Paenibacillus foliorum]
MGLVIKLRKFFSLDWRTMLLFFEAFIYLGWARYLVYQPFHKIAPSLGTHLEETSQDKNDKNRKALKNVHYAIHIMSNHTFWDSKCLVKALAGMSMLQRRGIESTLYLGTAKEDSGKMIAHAWLRSGPFIVTGVEGMERFTVVGTFAQKINDQ